MSDKTFQSPLTCGDGLYGSIHQGNRLIAVAEGSTTIEQQDRAKRIVLCVNYCAGEPDSALELFTAKEQVDLTIKYIDERDTYRDLCAELLESLTIIAQWEKFPATGEFWGSGKEMSFETCYGSNGTRDYMRSVASSAITKAESILGEKNGTSN